MRRISQKVLPEIQFQAARPAGRWSGARALGQERASAEREKLGKRTADGERGTRRVETEEEKLRVSGGPAREAGKIEEKRRAAGWLDKTGLRKPHTYKLRLTLLSGVGRGGKHGDCPVPGPANERGHLTGLIYVQFGHIDGVQVEQREERNALSFPGLPVSPVDICSSTNNGLSECEEEPEDGRNETR
ncbi:hypothetical protein WN55_07476 [Dufourea novaeangliae]|uniref:Uncharacterized protein n=1 Tax=Dufourea novaeangliae TaxID=178035 RepID=A0A154PSJ6_DUFNO|nr:hypothetical protein WN55_07476 [Dufourea novaeangliae]